MSSYILEPEVYQKPPRNPALDELRTAETEQERVIQSAILNKSTVVNIPATDKYRFPIPVTKHTIFFLLLAAALYYGVVRK